MCESNDFRPTLLYWGLKILSCVCFFGTFHIETTPKKEIKHRCEFKVKIPSQGIKRNHFDKYKKSYALVILYLIHYAAEIFGIRSHVVFHTKLFDQLWFFISIYEKYIYLTGCHGSMWSNVMFHFKELNFRLEQKWNWFFYLV